jgi:hypothetical protein
MSDGDESGAKKSEKGKKMSIRTAYREMKAQE